MKKFRTKKRKKRLLAKKKEFKNTVDNLKILQLAFDNAFAHIVITDKDGYILYANRSAQELTGYSQKEIIGNKPSLWGKQMPQSFYENFWRIIKTEKKPYTGEITNKRKNGKLYEAEVRISPILDDNDEIKFFVALERDITEQKEIDKAKDEFLSLAAHQLRTPLATISLTVEILLKNIAGNISAESKKYLKNILKETKDMAEMIRTFLNISRVEMGKFKMEPEPVKLFEAIENAIKRVLPQIRDKKIHFKKNYKRNLPVLNLDKRVIRIILENFLSNAIKYSHNGGEIILGVKESDNAVTIEVTDNGVGIPARDQSKIFTKMFRAGNVSSIKSGGSGLGLYLTKSLAEQSSYKISFKSKESEGSAFSVSIPKKNAF